MGRAQGLPGVSGHDLTRREKKAIGGGAVRDRRQSKAQTILMGVKKALLGRAWTPSYSWCVAIA